jgi:hypothetical protein
MHGTIPGHSSWVETKGFSVASAEHWSRPSLTSWFRSLASVNHRVIRCLPESSVAFGGSRSFLGVPSGAASAEAKSRSRLRSSAGLVGGMSAALMASSPLAVLKVPATALPIATFSLWNLSSS